jgi:hypothetical protein
VSTCSIDLYTGSIKQQTFLQNLGESVDVSKASSVTTVIDADVGPDGAGDAVSFPPTRLRWTKTPSPLQQAHTTLSASHPPTSRTRPTHSGHTKRSALDSRELSVRDLLPFCCQLTREIASFSPFWGDNQHDWNDR